MVLLRPLVNQLELVRAVNLLLMLEYYILVVFVGLLEATTVTRINPLLCSGDPIIFKRFVLLLLLTLTVLKPVGILITFNLQNKFSGFFEAS